MPARDIAGRGNTQKEAVEDMWRRMVPLEKEGYHPISSVEVVDTKTNKVIESFQLTDPEWAYLRGPGRSESGKATAHADETGSHRPPTSHEFRYKARVKLQL